MKETNQVNESLYQAGVDFSRLLHSMGIHWDELSNIAEMVGKIQSALDSRQETSLLDVEDVLHSQEPHQAVRTKAEVYWMALSIEPEISTDSARNVPEIVIVPAEKLPESPTVTTFSRCVTETESASAMPAA